MTTPDSPKGWSTMSIGDVLVPFQNGKVISQGWSPQCDKEPSDSPDEWGVLKTTAIQPGAFQPQHNKRLPPTLSADPNIEVHAGDLLLTCAGPRSRCGIPCLVRHTRPRLMTSGKMYRFRANEAIVLPEFLELVLLGPSAQRSINEMKTGTSESGLNLTHARFSMLRFAVPPLPEQHQIVGTVEAVLSRLDAAVAGVRNAAQRAEGLRTSILRRAFTEAAASDWTADTTPLGQLADLSLGKMLDRKSATGLHPTPYLRNINVRWHRFELDDLAAMDIRPDELDRVSVRPGDVVVCEGGEPGRAAVWRSNDEMAIQKALHRVRPSARLDADFFVLYLDYMARAGLLSAYCTGTTIKHLPKEKLALLPVPAIPVEDQRRSATQTLSQLEQLAPFAHATANAAKCADGLRRSLLHSATTGALTKPWREMRYG